MSVLAFLDGLFALPRGVIVWPLPVGYDGKELATSLPLDKSVFICFLTTGNTSFIELVRVTAMLQPSSSWSPPLRYFVESTQDTLDYYSQCVFRSSSCSSSSFSSSSSAY